MLFWGVSTSNLTAKEELRVPNLTKLRFVNISDLPNNTFMLLTHYDLSCHRFAFGSKKFETTFDYVAGNQVKDTQPTRPARKPSLKK